MKDIRIQKKTFLLVFFYSIFMFFFFEQSDAQKSIYTVMGSIIAYMFILRAAFFDEKNKSELLLLSLPIKKHYIVIAKYLSAFLFCTISLILSGGVGAILHITGILINLPLIRFINIFTTFISLGILISIYYPLYFKFGSTNTRLLNVFWFLIAFSVPKLLAENKNIQLISFIKHIHPLGLSLFVILILIILLMISLFVSLKIYKNKDF
jgi:ABC-type transport system involved in multi-copper enzyme maturation permease subunit